jgi:hypothetical protein
MALPRLSGDEYWAKPPGTSQDDLQVAVNGRYTYWMSRHPIPGGVAFENFEMRERFHPGQRFVFGITRRTPGELGLGPGGRQPQTGVRTVAPADARAAPDRSPSPHVAAAVEGPQRTLFWWE